MTEIQISVVYALADRQEVVRMRCPQGITIGQAIHQSKVCAKYPEIDLESQEVGVHGLKQGLDFNLSDNDRVEIYRPLLVSPMEARRLRAESKSNKTNPIKPDE